MSDKEDAHHVTPRSRGGKDDISNIIYIDQDQHRAYHRLFVNCTPEEILGVINALYKLNSLNGLWRFNLVTLVEVLRNREQGWFVTDGVNYVINVKQDDVGKEKYKRNCTKNKINEDGMILFGCIDLWHIVKEIKRNWVKQNVFETSKSA